MVTATFEFQGYLNDFLDYPFRHRMFESACAESATTKHMIEAFGVPHTEVGRVVVNDEASSLHHLLQEGDHVVIHPPGIPVQNEEGAGLPAAPPLFLADAHLGGLARLLRMAGFDTFYDNAIHDDDVVRIAAEQNRIILSRDRELLKRRMIVSGCYIRSLEPASQMKEVVTRFSLAQHARPFTLCLHCNRLLASVDKASVLESLPPSVRNYHTEFSRCACCKRVYWRGSHWQRMQAMLKEIVADPADSDTSETH
ncbi:Mut7-C RNAse domain-containing protein [Oxalobacteraceae bacterium R-40]|uniref:Mut7-C RNAse domain-containing protein n=1 Tax=Keguizhuia sedimenti TaxID=3064264 RepID=A0ABU1BSU7_9BURK|nr:Mut7-C RNAse domain-containing protein [Oxalobacteraceae bacterium R-40]